MIVTSGQYQTSHFHHASPVLPDLISVVYYIIEVRNVVIQILVEQEQIKSDIWKLPNPHRIQGCHAKN